VPPKSTQRRTPFTILKEQLQVVDLLLEVRDARIPESSRHPGAGQMFGDKPRIIVLAKQDLAEPAALKQFLAGLSTDDVRALPVSLKQNKGQKRLFDEALRLTKARRDAWAAKGLLPRPMRATVVGLPNVGKSSLINWLIGSKRARVGDKPGITKGTQWVRVHPEIELLDTPGLLPPVSFEKEVANKLAVCNILPDDRYDIEEISEWALARIASTRRDMLERYGLNLAESEPTLENLAKMRSFLSSGGRPDTRRAGAVFLNELRSGKLGPFVLDEIRP
jgi:ribosome biogenesis GTPase A